MRVYGNGNRISGKVRLVNGCGSSNAGVTTGMGDVGDSGSFYVEGCYWPKYLHTPGTPGSKEDCVTIFNHKNYGDGRSVKCVIIQRCGGFGIWGIPSGHGDFYQVQGMRDLAPMRIGYTYISECTIST